MQKEENTNKEFQKTEEDNKKLPEKKSVFLVWLLGIVTLGIYYPIWYIKRAPEFNNLHTSKKLNKNIAITSLVISAILISLNLLSPLFNSITPSSESYIAPIIITILIFGSLISLTSITLFIFMAFRSRTIINEIWQKKGINKKVSWFFTLIFNLLYIQYEINRTIENREEKKRIGPWIIFISIIILIPVLTFLWVYLLFSSEGFALSMMEMFNMI